MTHCALVVLASPYLKDLMQLTLGIVSLMLEQLRLCQLDKNS
jgi:hypothetical protein